MDFNQIKNRAKEIRKLYAEIELEQFGREWTKEEIFQGLVGDIGDLSRYIVACEGIWPKHFGKNKKELNENIAHELADCLWSIIILADKYDIDIEKSFEKAMVGIEKRIKKN